MKVNAKSLKQAIGILKQAIGKSKNLAILGKVHAEEYMDAAGTPCGIRFTATDLSERVSVSVAGEGNFSPVPVVVDLLKLESVLKGGEVDLAVTGEVVTGEVGGFRVDIGAGFSANEFPLDGDIGEKVYDFDVNHDWLRAFSEASSHVATDDGRRILYGVCVSERGLAGTDGKRAYINREATCCIPWNERISVINTKCFRSILKYATQGVFQVYAKKSNEANDVRPEAYFRFTTCMVPGLLINYTGRAAGGLFGAFPDYLQVVPDDKHFNIEAVVDPKAFKGLCEAGNFKKRNEPGNCVGMKYVSGQVEITCKDFTGSLPVTEKLFIPEVPFEPVGGYNGPSAGQPGCVRDFGIRGSFLTDIANIGVIGIRITDGYSPIWFDLLNGGYSIIMPIRKK